MLGLVMAWLVSGLLDSYRYEVDPRDPPVFVAISAVLFSSGALACLLPARRASRVDPAETLKAD